MNNFRKHCAFYIITFTPWRPHEGGKSRRSPPRKLQNYFLHVKCLFSPIGGPCFILLEAIFSLWGGSPYVAKFLCLSPLCKNFYDAHALGAKVVANIVPWRNLREIARLARHPIC